MSIYFEFDVGSTGRRFRRAVEEDRKEVETILSDDIYYEKVFGKVDVGCLMKYYLSRNTLFIHAMGCHNSVEEFFLAEAMMTVFNNDAYLQQIVLMPPPDCPREFIMKHPIFKKHNISRYCAKREDDKEHGYHYFYATNRQDICPKLRIRRALNDRIGGVMSLNSDIDYAKLQNTYELDPYHGLQKATPLEKEHTKRKNTLLRAF
ncbi:unnamed protein product, partial [Leptidea sinapis]